MIPSSRFYIAVNGFGMWTLAPYNLKPFVLYTTHAIQVVPETFYRNLQIVYSPNKSDHITLILNHSPDGNTRIVIRRYLLALLS